MSFRLEVVPYIKHSLQRRIYNYIVRRQSKRAAKSRILDLVAAQERLRLQAGARPNHASERALSNPKAGAMSAISGSTAANDGAMDAGERGERGYRRRKLAAMAGNLYRTGQQAVTDLRETYAQTRGRGMDEAGQESIHIPDAFPDVAISSQGVEQMVLFPSYAKRHVKRDWSRAARNTHPPPPDLPEVKADEWWRQEWERHEDEKAIVDVDVRGWIYSPQAGPMTRRNRILIGLARQLSGISAPRADPVYEPTGMTDDHKSHHEKHEEKREQERIAQEAADIEKRGQEEKNAAYKGDYSEPQDSFNHTYNPAGYGRRPRSRRRGSTTPESAPSSPTLSARPSTNVNELTDAELAVANANLMARVAPFLTNPLVSMPITIFFYNNDHSQSKTIQTDDTGHFNIRAALDFIPTQVRVLANERLSATHDVQVTEPSGVSLISDIDDTIKRSNISSGAREIFRNTFVRDLRDLCVDGVREWYTEMHNLGVSMHYCSNSPWQLYPVLASFFKIAGLPPGSLHLKQYSGMLQGIFEPVAERKKNTLGRLVNDFPRRKFLLVGDSGEADLEVYTELALANPGRILAIFIRDVTTPETAGYFDTSSLEAQRRVASLSLNDGSKPSSLRQNSAPGSIKGEPSAGPAMGTLIDFSEEPQAAELDQAAALAQIKKSTVGRTPTATELLATRKPPPPRPAKPAALRSTPARSKTPPPQPKRPAGLGVESLQPLTTIHSADHDVGMRSAGPAAKEPEPVPPPLPRRRSGLKNLSPRLFGRGSSNSDVDFEPLPPSAAPPSSLGFSYYRSSSRSGNTTPSSSPTLGPQGTNKKVELWRRRLLRANEVLDSQGVALYTWRTGQDVVAEATGIVKRAMERR